MSTKVRSLRNLLAVLFVVTSVEGTVLAANQGANPGLKGTLSNFDEKQSLIGVTINGQERVFRILPNTEMYVYRKGTKDFLDVGNYIDMEGSWKPGTNLIKPGRELTVHLVPEYSLRRDTIPVVQRARSADSVPIKLAGPIVNMAPVQIRASGLRANKWILDESLRVPLLTLNGNGTISFQSGSNRASANFRGRIMQFDAELPATVRLNVGQHLEYAGADAKVQIFLRSGVPGAVFVTSVLPPLSPDEIKIPGRRGRRDGKRKKGR